MQGALGHLATPLIVMLLIYKTVSLRRVGACNGTELYTPLCLALQLCFHSMYGQVTSPSYTFDFSYGTAIHTASSYVCALTFLVTFPLLAKSNTRH